MTSTEARKYLKISYSTLKRWEKIKALVPDRIGKRRDRFYTMEMINNFLNNSKVS